jgi:hypothetical protein
MMKAFCKRLEPIRIPADKSGIQILKHLGRSKGIGWISDTC